ncbi:MAG TPA: D-alanine--D-alanine ligase [Candidatus Dormibacteraeota bacterium]|nr:D-alanine--D-alanine ligase [Candidatus Dormibacteraeota bacterium]
MKNNNHIEIVRTTIKGLSSMSLKSAEAILAVLSKHYVSVRLSTVNNVSDLQAVVARNPDLVFLGLEFISLNPSLGQQDPNRIWLTSYFEEHGITCTGSNQMAHQLERHKPTAKQHILNAGLKTSAYCVIEQGQAAVMRDITMPFPLFIKPTNRGGGLGIDSDSVVYDFKQLLAKVKSIADNLNADSLIEEYLSGREFSVAILKKEESDKFFVMPIELIAPLDTKDMRILSSQVKSSDAEQAIEITDKVIRSNVTSFALKIFQALGARDYGRIDIRMDKHAVPHFLEANLIPSLISGYGSFPKACLLNVNLAYEPMILTITKLALERTVPESHEFADSLVVPNTIFPRFEVAV